MIDFSNATKLGVGMRVFVGMPPFVHRRVHQNVKRWKTKKENDVVGLVFVFVYLFLQLSMRV